MYIEYVNDLNADSLLDDELFDELFSIESEYEHEKKLIELEDRAKSCGVKSRFDKLYRAKKKEITRLLKAEQTEVVLHANETQFSAIEYEGLEQLECGDWIADDDGVWIHTDKGKAIACYHPIYPVRQLRNSETGLYKLELHFYIRHQIRTALVDMATISTPNRIVQLANNSVMVTGLTAPLLVQYINEVIARNPDKVKECASTSRLGWITEKDQFENTRQMFLPYDQENIVFDNEQSVKSLFDSIKECGERSVWFDCAKGIRQRNRQEINIYLASSFASVLVEPCGALPFIVSLWGGTGIGKTVSLMLATSIWADPSEGAYMTDAKATSTAMEIRLNILNSLPMTLDDMAQIKNQQDEDFSQLIYRWCAGKGRDRSNVNLGLNKLTSWRNCTITNGERSLVDESTQGGAVNRVIDIEHRGAPLFEGADGNNVANILRNNFGFAGRDFVELIENYEQFTQADKITKDDGVVCEKISDVMQKWFKSIKDVAAQSGCEKEDKQIMPMALILTADELTEKYIFKDGVRLDLEQCVGYLKNKGEVSEHKRAYEYLCDQIEMEQYHFAENIDEEWFKQAPNWGFWVEQDEVAILPSAFNELLKKGGFQSRAFRSWAKDNNLLVHDKGKSDKLFRKGGSVKRYIVLKTDIDLDAGFEDVEDDLEELPFT